MPKKKWSIDNVIKDRGIGNIHLDFDQDDSDNNEVSFLLVSTLDNNPTTDDHVRQILTKDDLDLTKVTYMDLASCSLITDDALKLVGEKCNRLEILHVSDCVTVTDEGIRAVLQTNPNMKVLWFNVCKKVTVESIRAVIEYAPNITTLNARGTGVSILPDDIQFGTLIKLQEFNLSGNGLKKLPKSMATLPHDCDIDINSNQLESPPIEMAGEYGNMPPPIIGRFYAEEMLNRPDFNLSVLDTHIKECGGTIGTNGYHSNCAIITTAIRAQTGFSVELKEECEKRLDDDKERLADVRKDKNLIENLTYDGSPTIFYLHAVCKSYYVTLDIIEFCINEFSTDIALKKDKSELMPYDVLARNPCATEECKKFLRQFVTNFSNVHQAGGVSDDPRNTKDRLGYDIYAKAIVNVVDKVELGNKTNFSVGLFAPWGVGKSKLWYLIKQEIKNKEKMKMKEWKKNHDKDDQNGINKHRAGSSAVFESFSTWCEINHSLIYCCRGKNDDNGDDSAITGISQVSSENVPLVSGGNESRIIGDRKTKDASNDANDIETGDANQLSRSESGDWSAKEARDNETLAAAMVLTCPIWISPLIIQSCIRLCLRPCLKSDRDQKHARNVSKILAGDYVPYHIRSVHLHFGPIACVKTAIIMFARMFPFGNCGELFVRGQKCFAVPTIKEAPVNHHIFIEFNAWVYNGSDVLWASLMEKLWTAVEAELGEDIVRLHRASINLTGETGNENISRQSRMDRRELELYKFRAFAVISSILSVIGIVCGLYFLHVFDLPDDIEEALTDSTGEDVNPKDKATVEAIVIIIGAQIPLFRTVLDFFTKVFPELQKPRSKALLEEEKNQRHDFSGDMGFMGKVKKEIEHLFDLLESKMLYDAENDCWRPVRLSIFVDDLDRCDSKTVLKVLQAMKLLLDNEHNTVVTCYSAIDTRIVVASINAEFKDILNASGSSVGGYSYLGKFIQVPFCIPDLSSEKKALFIGRLFLAKYLENPALLYDSMLIAKAKIKSELDSQSLKWSGEACFDDFKVLRDSAIPNFSNAQHFGSKDSNLVGFLKDIQINKKTSKHLKDILNNGQVYLTKYSGSEKDNEEVLCLAMKYVQYFDSAYSQLMKRSQSDSQPPAPPSTQELKPASTEDISIESPDTEFLVPPNPAPTNPIQQLVQPESTGKEDIPVESFLQSMANPDENEWFQTFSKYLEGKPRAMTRIVNIYNVAREIAEMKLGEKARTAMFRKKLIIVVILVELWPYRMSWIFQIVENALEEEGLISLISRAEVKPNSSAGTNIADVMKQLFGNKNGSEKSESMLEIFSRVSLFEVYQKVARVLMHSPDNSKAELCRDSDPQLFEHLLLERDENINDIMMMSDIIPIDYMEKLDKNHGHTLQPFIFNMQRYMTETASKNMENIVILTVDGENDVGKIKYKHVEKHFEIV